MSDNVKETKLSNPNEPATNRQLWALFCITKKDHRNLGLTKSEASELISELKDKQDANELNVHKIIDEARNEGLRRMRDCVPTPMVVSQHKDMADDNSPVVKSWYVSEGACGFASIHLHGNTKTNRRFISLMKKSGLLLGKNEEGNGKHLFSYDSYRGGYSYWVGEGGQSITRKESFASGFVSVLKKYDIETYVSSRLD